MLAKRFPFAVYYLIEDDTIDFYAILDCRCDPEWIVKPLDSAYTKRGTEVLEQPRPDGKVFRSHSVIAGVRDGGGC